MLGELMEAAIAALTTFAVLRLIVTAFAVLRLIVAARLDGFRTMYRSTLLWFLATSSLALVLVALLVK